MYMYKDMKVCSHWSQTHTIPRLAVHWVISGCPIHAHMFMYDMFMYVTPSMFWQLWEDTCVSAPRKPGHLARPATGKDRVLCIAQAANPAASSCRQASAKFGWMSLFWVLTAGNVSKWCPNLVKYVRYCAVLLLRVNQLRSETHAIPARMRSWSEYEVFVESTVARVSPNKLLVWHYKKPPIQYGPWYHSMYILLSVRSMCTHASYYKGQTHSCTPAHIYNLHDEKA